MDCMANGRDPLFPDKVLGRHRRRYRLGDRERQPGIPAGGTVLGGELAISLQAEKCLILSNLEDVSDLRADAEHARAEAAENGGLAEVVRDLLVGVTDQAEKDLLS